MPRSVLRKEEVQRPRQLAVACETFELRAKVVGRPATGELRQFFVGRQRAANQKFARCVYTAIQVDGSEYGLERVHQETLLAPASRRFLAAAQLKVAAQLEFLSDGHQMGGADQVILQEGKLALAEPFVAVEERFADQQSEDRVPQELEAFVIVLSFRSE